MRLTPSKITICDSLLHKIKALRPVCPAGGVRRNLNSDMVPYSERLSHCAAVGSVLLPYDLAKEAA